MSRDRLHAAEATAIGGSMIGASAAANAGLDRMLERRNVKQPGRAVWHEAKRFVRGGTKTAVHPLHVPYVAGKVGTASVRTVGIPLAAYGAFNMISPGDKVARVRVKDDVVKPTVRTATGVAQAKRAKQRLESNRSARKRTQVGKSTLTDREDKQLQRRKQAGRNISLVAGTMGLGALGLRAPELARATGKIPRAAKVPGLGRLARREQGATKASNALGVAAIGTGSVGSFNYASQQKLERKKFAKAQLAFPGMPDKPFKALRTGKRVWTTPTGRKEVVTDHGPGETGLHKITRLHPKTGRESSSVTDPKRLGAWVKFGKRDDAFLRRYRERISPSAEAGYTHLKSGRNKAAGSAALNAALTPVNAASAVSGFRRGGKAGVAWGTGSAALAGYTGRNAVRDGKKAQRWNQHMGRIKAAARSRAAAGEYGRDRDVAKGLIPVLKPRIPLAARKPAIRGGHIATSPLGRKYTVRGSVR